MYVALSDIHRGFAATWATACLLCAVVVARHLIDGVQYLTLTLDLGAVPRTEQLAWLATDSWLIEALLAATLGAVHAFRRRRRLPAWSLMVPAGVAVLVAAMLLPWPGGTSGVGADLVTFGFSTPGAAAPTPRDRIRIVTTVVLAAAPLLVVLVGAIPLRRRNRLRPNAFGVIDLGRRIDP